MKVILSPEQKSKREKQNFTSHPKCRESFQHLLHPLPSKTEEKRSGFFQVIPGRANYPPLWFHLHAYFISSLVQTQNCKSQRQAQLSICKRKPNAAQLCKPPCLLAGIPLLPSLLTPPSTLPVASRKLFYTFSLPTSESISLKN